MKIIERKEETVEMSSYLEDDKSPLMAVIGRRRVGKTFLIKACLNDFLCFVPFYGFYIQSKIELNYQVDLDIIS